MYQTVHGLQMLADRTTSTDMAVAIICGMAKIYFIMDVRGFPCVCEVGKRYGNGWRCSVVEGALKGREIVASDDAIRVGKLRYSNSQRLSKTAGGSVPL